jgi:hypothetical protein
MTPIIVKLPCGYECKTTKEYYDFESIVGLCMEHCPQNKDFHECEIFMEWNEQHKDDW